LFRVVVTVNVVDVLCSDVSDVLTENCLPDSVSQLTVGDTLKVSVHEQPDSCVQAGAVHVYALSLMS